MTRLIIISACLILFPTGLFSQDKIAIIHIYRDKDAYSNNKIAKLFINDTLKIGLKGGCYDTIKIQNGCYDLAVGPFKNTDKYNKCFQMEQKYYFKIDYKYIFLIGRFRLTEVTESYAIKDLEGKVRSSYKK